MPGFMPEHFRVVGSKLCATASAFASMVSNQAYLEWRWKIERLGEFLIVRRTVPHVTVVVLTAFCLTHLEVLQIMLRKIHVQITVSKRTCPQKTTTPKMRSDCSK